VFSVSSPDPKPGQEERLTAVGCVLTTLSIAVIFIVALPVVRWRDQAGRPLPRMIAIVLPVLIGAIFHAIGTAILWLFGLRVLKEPTKEESEWREL
jgi:hypothetical protein